jgi:hypothetical protein
MLADKRRLRGQRAKTSAQNAQAHRESHGSGSIESRISARLPRTRAARARQITKRDAAPCCPRDPARFFYRFGACPRRDRFLFE